MGELEPPKLLLLHTHVRAADLLGNTLAQVDGDIRIYAQRHKVAAAMKMPEPKRDRRQLLSALASASWWRKSIPEIGTYHFTIGFSSLPYNFCQTFRAKKSIDTKALKLLRPVLEYAAQRLSRDISCVMLQVHSNLGRHY
eukprot:SAG11_NODE_7002_length_1210_cov_6.893789_1_plen_140_part_00